MSAEEALREKLRTGVATAAVIGLGYVGLPIVRALHDGGMNVLGFDIDPSKIEALKAGKNYLRHLSDDFVAPMVKSGKFDATTDFDRLGEADAIIVCVPTPLGRHHEPDLSYVLDSARRIGKTLRPGQLIALESTTYPGTTRDEFVPAMLEAAPDSAKGLRSGKDFFVVFSPEREDPGRTSHTTRTTPKLVGGLDEASTALGGLLYERAVESVVLVESAEVAESAKLLENIFRAVNIALINEMKVILSKMNIDVWDVVRAASTKPFGFMPFYPGPGLGGHCIPIDPFYLSWKAKEVGRPTRFIELAGQVNTEMPEYVIEQVMLALNARGKSVKGARALVLGLAYKADIDDTRESPSFELIERMRELGANVDYSDPHIPRTVPVRKHDLGMESVELTEKNLKGYDVVLIATAHSGFDYELIARCAPLVVDTRNAMREYASVMTDRLVKA